MMKIFLATADQTTNTILFQLLKKRLPAGSLECVTDGELLLRRIKVSQPRLVVLDVLLEKLDGISVMRFIRSLPPEKQPEVIFLSSLHSKMVLGEVAKMQPAYYATIPCDVQGLSERILSCCRERLRMQLEVCTSREQAIAMALHACGISIRCKGWSYMMEAISRIMDDPNCQFGLTKRLYPEIGKQYGASQASVERAIRSAIHSAWQIPGIPWQQVMFHKQPSNGDFLSTIAKYLREVVQASEEN